MHHFGRTGYFFALSVQRTSLQKDLYFCVQLHTTFVVSHRIWIIFLARGQWGYAQIELKLLLINVLLYVSMCLRVSVFSCIFTKYFARGSECVWSLGGWNRLAEVQYDVFVNIITRRKEVLTLMLSLNSMGGFQSHVKAVCCTFFFKEK